MHVDPQNPKMVGRDRLVVSKGHAGPAVYAALALKGYFPVLQLDTLNRPGTSLPSHCDMLRTPGIDMTAGSLGQGFSCAVGIAIGSQIRGDGGTVYTVIGDGESQEGQIWEAAMLAAHKRLNNLIAFTDYNNMQIDGLVSGINDLADLAAKWRAFNWNVVEVPNGNDVCSIHEALCLAESTRRDRPSMLILHTVKGKGVSFVETAGTANHNMKISPEQREQALLELR
jgi:transketolase